MVEKVLGYVQGISEVRGYNLTGRTSKKLNQAIEENRNINTKMELKFVPLMQIQSGIIKLTGVDKAQAILDLPKMDIEKIVDLNPQVVIVPYNCDYEGIASQLEPFGIKLFVVSANKNEDFEHEVTNVGKMFGVEKQAQAIIDYFNEQMKYLQNALKNVEPKTVYAEYLTDYQAEIPFDGVDVFESIHAKNVFGFDFEADSHDGIEMDPEEILTRDPDAIRI